MIDICEGVEDAREEFQQRFLLFGYDPMIFTRDVGSDCFIFKFPEKVELVR